jgi:Tfp pilus assembly protein PilF
MNLDPATSPLSRAQQLVRLRRPEEAAALLAQALSTDPTSAACHRLLAQCFIQMKRLPEALEEANIAIKLEPDSEWAFRLRSVSLLALGKASGWPAGLRGRGWRRAGLRAAKEAVRLAPNSSVAFLQLASAYLANRNPFAAAGAADQAVRLAPASAGAFNTLGLVALRMGRVDAAEIALRKALQLDPQNAEALNNLGLVARATGRRGEAPGLFGASARANPSLRFGAQNAARMSNALFGQSFITAFLVFVLLAIHAIGLADLRPVWWLVALAAGGAAYGAVHIWRSLRDSYRPTLLDFSLSARGRLVSLAIALLGGVAGAAIAGPVSGGAVLGCSLLVSLVSLGRARARSSRGEPLRPFFLVLLICAFGFLGILSLSLALFGALPAFIRAAPGQGFSDLLGFGGGLLLGLLFGAFAWGGVRGLRWRRGGGPEVFDKLVAGAVTGGGPQDES